MDLCRVESEGRCSWVFEKSLIRLSGDISLMVHSEEIVSVSKILRVIRLEVLIIV